MRMLHEGSANREKSTYQLESKMVGFDFGLGFATCMPSGYPIIQKQLLGQTWYGFPNHARIIVQQINSMMERDGWMI